MSASRATRSSEGTRSGATLSLAVEAAAARAYLSNDPDSFLEGVRELRLALESGRAGRRAQPGARAEPVTREG